MTEIVRVEACPGESLGLNFGPLQRKCLRIFSFSMSLYWDLRQNNKLWSETSDYKKYFEMIGETGLNIVLPGILIEAESDIDIDEDNEETPSSILTTRVKSEFLQVKTELPDSSDDFIVMMVNRAYVNILSFGLI